MRTTKELKKIATKIIKAYGETARVEENGEITYRDNGKFTFTGEFAIEKITGNEYGMLNMMLKDWVLE